MAAAPTIIPTISQATTKLIARASTVIALSVALFLAQDVAAESAFPGAVGYGAGAVGWKGGSVLTVTNLNDSGPGSLRDCAEGNGPPRVCVFAVSGTIDLTNAIWVGPNTYIAGQTAPGDGIQLRIVEGKVGTLILKNVNDVVVRFLKARPGVTDEQSSVVDAVTVENGQRVYLGNLSLAFASDETVNIHVSNATAQDITLADSIVALSLDRSNHAKGRHSKGALICSDEGPTNACGRISLIRNLFAHHRDRQPDIKATDIGPVEVINNVFYNPISQFGEFYDLLGDAAIAYIGNVALTGPDTIRKTPEAVQVFEWEDDYAVALWAEGNIADTPDGCRARRFEVLDVIAMQQQVPPGSWPLTTDPLPAAEALETVLSRSGDRIEGHREPDSLDAAIIGDVQNCTGQIIDEVEQVGGWPDITSDNPVADSDLDGLPDAWEETRDGLDPNRIDDPWALDPQTGLSHVETWLAIMAGDLS